MTISPADFVRRWGPALSRAREDALATLRIPEDAKRFLREAGLPGEGVLLLHFELEKGLPFVPVRPGLGCPSDLRYLGTDEGTAICLSGASGEVWSLPEEHGSPPRFMNTGVPQLAECMLAYREYAAQVAEAPDEDAELELVAAFEGVLTRADSPALKKPDNWWSVVLEQCRDGLL